MEKRGGARSGLTIAPPWASPLSSAAAATAPATTMSFPAGAGATDGGVGGADLRHPPLPHTSVSLAARVIREARGRRWEAGAEHGGKVMLADFWWQGGRWSGALSLLHLLSPCAPLLQHRRRRGAISSSLLPRHRLSSFSVMVWSSNRWMRWGPSESVAHTLECALFGARGTPYAP
jgi:hypothetical protein